MCESTSTGADIEADYAAAMARHYAELDKNRREVLAQVALLVSPRKLATSQAQQALAPENQRVVPVEPLLAKPHPLELLAADHKGMRVDYSGLLKQSCRALRVGTKDLGLAELLSQLHGHMTELGQRWYRGDTAVVDELLQLYAVEDGARDVLKKARGGDK